MNVIWVRIKHILMFVGVSLSVSGVIQEQRAVELISFEIHEILNGLVGAYVLNFRL